MLECGQVVTEYSRCSFLCFVAYISNSIFILSVLFIPSVLFKTRWPERIILGMFCMFCEVIKCLLSWGLNTACREFRNRGSLREVFSWKKLIILVWNRMWAVPYNTVQNPHVLLQGFKYLDFRLYMLEKRLVVQLQNIGWSTWRLCCGDCDTWRISNKHNRMVSVKITKHVFTLYVCTCLVHACLCICSLTTH
jgi:hypothetical protein